MTLAPPLSPSGKSLPRTLALIEGGRQVGLHTAAQMYVAVGQQIVADFGWGQTRDGVEVTADTLMLWLSAGKPVGAAAIMQLVERGQLSLDEPVARLIPEFAQHGKQSITLFQLLTHTAGYRLVDVGALGTPWDETISRICATEVRPDWASGERAGYQPYASWFLLGEIVRRVDGRDFGTYVREMIFLPLGMIDSWIGMPRAVYEAYGPRMATSWHTDKATPYPHRYTAPEAAELCVPGGNAKGPMHDLGRFYHMLAGGGQWNGVRILSEASVAQMTARQRAGLFDETFRHTMDWGLGLIIDSNRYGPETVPYGYGRYASERTFGHGGAQSSIAFCDPERELVAAITFDGLPGEGKHNARMRALLAALYEDLGFD
jgi:CubicO group peptidase (beta-lactamase class C family)